MTDKERLEEVVKNVVFLQCGLTGAPMGVELTEDDYWYLYEQAERVQKLEQQIKRYREALEEIANKKMTYADMFGAIRTAKEALEGEDHNE